jgi:2-oxo-4-hydroxy-4-carboxy-5-ureidoimidazoline decarboxylase
MTLPTLDTLNRCSAAEFVAHLGSVFEHAPWVAEAVADARPFASADALHAAMMARLHALPEPACLALLRGHPELAGAVARSGAMTADSVAEQGTLALAAVAQDEAAEWDRLNAAYNERFGFPFILCIRRHGRDSALREFERRLAQDRPTELAAALREIGRISRLRLAGRIEAHGMAGLHGRLTTHALDISRGQPAAGLRVELFEVAAAGRRRLSDVLLDANGSTAAPLMGAAPLPKGRYELHFHVGAYFRQLGVSDGGEAFLEVVPVAFGLFEPEGDYHVPITLTPWAYGTYRGS